MYNVNDTGGRKDKESRVTGTISCKNLPTGCLYNDTRKFSGKERISKGM